MHVTFLIPMLGAGGAERVTIDIARGIKPELSYVEIITNETTGEFVEAVTKDIPVSSVETYNWFAVVFRLYQHFKTKKPDIVLAQGTRMSIAASLAVKGLRQKPKIVWCLHNPYSSKYNIFPKPIAWAITKGLRVLARKATAIIGVSEGVCESFVEYFGSDFGPKVKVIHNPIPAYSSELKDKLKPNVPPVLIAVGRLEHQKNFELLIEAMPIILKSNDCRLDIYGVGPLQQDLENQIKHLELQKNIHLKGYEANIRDKMKEADIFVLSSRWEGLPTVLIEAMGTGVPVVSTNCTYGPDEILEKGRWGKLVPPENINALAEAVIDILKNGGIDPTERAKDFEPDKIIAQYLVFLRNLG